MRFKVNNIAKVKCADIVLDGITVVAGGNGTGKSTISKSLFAIMYSNKDLMAKAVSQKNRSINRVYSDFTSNSNVRYHLSTRKYKDLIQKIKIITDKYISNKENFVDELVKFLKEVNAENVSKESIEKMYVSLLEISKRDMEFYSRYAVQLIFSQIFAKQINTVGFYPNGEVVVEEEDRCFSVHFGNNVVEKMERTDYTVSQINPIYITTSDLNECVANVRQLYYLKVADGISFANKELNNLLYKEANLNDFTAEMFEKMTTQKSEFGRIVDEIVNGKLVMENDKLVFYDNWCQGTIDFSNIASGLKIFIILQRLISNGAFLDEPVLIIDEPETNLHPEWQVKLANILVLLNKELGIKIYMNSHSPYFVRAIEFFSCQYGTAEKCRYYFMETDMDSGMFMSVDVTEQLGVIYDKLAEPFNLVM